MDAALHRGRALHRRPAIRRFRPATGAVDTWAAPTAVGDGVAPFDAATGDLETLCRLPDLPPGHRFDGGRCDLAGRFWISTMHGEARGPEGALHRLDGAGRAPPLRPRARRPAPSRQPVLEAG